MMNAFTIARLVLPRLLLLLLTVLLVGPGHGWAQVPTFTQAVSFNPSAGNGGSGVNAVATDAVGNQYVTGGFSGTLVLGSTTLVSAGDPDVYVAKRSAVTGAWLWAVRAGGSGSDVGTAVAVDANGNAVVTGPFIGPVSFATSPASTTLTSASGSADVFVAKFEASTGACIWAVGAGGRNFDTGYGVAVDAGGNAFVTGYFSSTASFATSTTLANLVSAGSSDVFVAKFEASTGACVWAVRAGGSGNDFSRGVAVDAGGNILIAGRFDGTASFATGSALTTLVSAGGFDIFVAKFEASTGACVWAVRAGGSGIDYGEGVTIDGGGNALVTGYFNGTASFATSPTSTALTSVTGNTDVFVAKFGASTGTCSWAVRAGGNGSDVGTGVDVDAGGNALVTGYFDGTASFATSPTSTTLTSSGLNDVFIARFGASTGACAWAVRAGGNGNDYGNGIAAEGNNAVVVGPFRNTASFGSLALVGNSDPNVSTGFLAVLAGAGTLLARSPTLSALTLFPNPAHTTCQVQGTAAGAAVTLCDALGRPLAHALADAGGTARLALPAGLAPGIYLVRCGGQVRRLAVE